MSPLRIEASGRTDPGRRRPVNEDFLLLDPAHGLFLLADGMGGHAAGEVASRLAVESVRDSLLAAPSAQGDAAETAARLEEAVRQANARILDEVGRRPELRGMGTTLVAAAAAAAEVVLAHVGDSRAYRIAGGAIHRVTSDHSWVEEQVSQGVLTPGEADRHPFRNIITRALGARELVEPDLARVAVAAGERLLLCSDGLSTMLPDAEILRIVQEGGGPEQICGRLVDAANAAGGADNITVLLLEFREAA